MSDMKTWWGMLLGMSPTVLRCMLSSSFIHFCRLCRWSLGQPHVTWHSDCSSARCREHGRQAEGSGGQNGVWNGLQVYLRHPETRISYNSKKHEFCMATEIWRSWGFVLYGSYLEKWSRTTDEDRVFNFHWTFTGQRLLLAHWGRSAALILWQAQQALCSDWHQQWIGMIATTVDKDELQESWMRC